MAAAAAEIVVQVEVVLVEASSLEASVARKPPDVCVPDRILDDLKGACPSKRSLKASAGSLTQRVGLGPHLHEQLLRKLGVTFLAADLLAIRVNPIQEVRESVGAPGVSHSGPHIQPGETGDRE